PDHTQCTPDDLQVPAAPVSIPLTTGTATGTVVQAVTTPGVCTGDGLSSCLETINCAAVGGTCGGTSPACTANQGGPCDAPSFTNLAAGPMTGTKTSCVNYDKGSLSNLALVGAVPAPGGDPPLGDVAIDLKLTCQ